MCYDKLMDHPRFRHLIEENANLRKVKSKEQIKQKLKTFKEYESFLKSTTMTTKEDIAKNQGWQRALEWVLSL